MHESRGAITSGYDFRKAQDVKVTDLLGAAAGVAVTLITRGCGATSSSSPCVSSSTRRLKRLKRKGDAQSDQCGPLQ
jgi:hypothetical protein